jgi:hypothetical protein
VGDLVKMEMLLVVFVLFARLGYGSLIKRHTDVVCGYVWGYKHTQLIVFTHICFCLVMDDPGLVEVGVVVFLCSKKLRKNET